MNHKLVGFMGLKGSGKNHIASLVTQNIVENRLGLVSEFAFADTLYQGACNALDLPWKEAKKYSGKDKEMLRHALNALGISGRYFNKKSWLLDKLNYGLSNFFKHHAAGSSAVAIVTDVRLREEVELIQSLGGRIVLIFDPDVYLRWREQLTDLDENTDPATMTALDFEMLAFHATRALAYAHRDPRARQAGDLIDYVFPNTDKNINAHSPSILDLCSRILSYQNFNAKET